MTISHDEHEVLIRRDICFECIGDSYLAGLVEKDGQNAECFYCQEEQACISLQALADRVESAFETHFARTAEEPNSFEYAMQNDREIEYEWFREGQKTGYAIMDAANLQEEVAMSVRDILEFRHEDRDSLEMGMECDFAAEAHYEEIMPEDHEWYEQWNEFEKLIKTEARFFSRTAASHLGKLFDHIDQMRTWDGKSLVVNAGPCTAISELFRCRVFQSEAPLLKAMQRPDLELAAPPAWAAGAGRMNARGISVFYGANSPEIALAEVRPPVGSKVAMARFEIIRPLKLLDLAALGNVMERGSIFDQDYAYRLGRMCFLSTLSNKMARPVMPDDQEMEYLPTQAIADYLSTEGQVPMDGIVFPSVQVGGNGLNVVLFHKASRSEVLDIPEGMEIRARTYSIYNAGPEPDYSVTEEMPPIEERGEKKKPTSFDHAMEDRVDPSELDPRDATLKIDLQSVRVHEVRAVKIETNSYAVSRYRFDSRKTQF